MTLDELFDVADCYVEEFNIISHGTTIPNPYKNTISTKDWTTICTYAKDNTTDQNSIKLNGGITYDTNSTCTLGTCDYLLESKH